MQNDLISRSALLEEFNGIYDRHFKNSAYQFIHDFFKAARRRINKAPTVDAVEVVRCKDCKFAYINSFSAAAGVAVCKKLSTEAGTAIRNHDDFCSYGERRADV